MAMKRSIGHLALAFIPWALGLGALVWLAVWMTGHEFRRQLSQEDRAAIAVGAAERPTSPLVIEFRNTGCLRLTRADVQGPELRLYAINECHTTIRYMKWHWQLLSPDGTVIAEHWDNSCPLPTQHGDKAECVIGGGSRFSYGAIPADDRATKLRVWADQ